MKNYLMKAKDLEFRTLQANAVVATNTSALKLYRKFGFMNLVWFQKVLLMKDGHYETITPHHAKV